MADLYSGQMLSAVTDMSYGILSIVPKYADGTPITDFEDVIITENGRELKAWDSIARYMASFSDTDGDGIANVPAYYSTTHGRKLVDTSRSPLALLKNPNKFTAVYAGLLAVAVLLIVLVVLLIRKLVKKARHRAAYGRPCQMGASGLYWIRIQYKHCPKRRANMESEKIILDIVVDVQKDFITGALANPAAQANVAHLADTAKAHAEAGHWMFFTRDTHPDNYLETREGRHLPVEHCIEGEDGWNLAPELENAMAGTEPAVCRVINKATFGSYMLPSDILDELMAHNKAVTDLEKIVIYGYCTDICVISNAMVLRAAFPETEIEILSDCCAGVTPDTHRTALDAMRACQFTIL